MIDIVSDSLKDVNSILRIPFHSNSLKNIHVQKIDEIYRARLALLISEAGSQTRLAEKIGKSPAQISQWLNASIDAKSGKPRVMSRGIARQIETDMKKPEGWMDQPVSAMAGDPETESVNRSVPLPYAWTREALECASMIDRLKKQADRERIVALVIQAVLDRMPSGHRGLGPNDAAASPPPVQPIPKRPQAARLKRRNA